MGRLDELVANARTTGHAVTVTQTGTAQPVPPGVALSAYRLVQESLSNAMRHAPGSAVEVRLDYLVAPPMLRVQIRNGPAGSDHAPVAMGHGPGHGLVGMRERAAMLGGELSATPTADGGFAVVGSLPLE